MVEEKTAIIIILAIVVVAAVPVLVMNMTSSNTGQFYYAGHAIQYESPADACRSVNCATGHAVPLESSGDLWPYGNQRMVVRCYCPENPSNIFTVPMVESLPLERY